MNDEDKSREELILELRRYRNQCAQLKQVLLKYIDLKSIGGNETILVVDDEKPVLETISHMLKKYGYAVLTAGSYQAAMEILTRSETKIHLLLTDVVMPDNRGPETLGNIKEMLPDLKIVYMSGFISEEIVHNDVFDIIRSGLPFIQKPFSHEEIGLMIKLQLV